VSLRIGWVKTWRRQATGSAEGTGRSEAEEPRLSQNMTERPIICGEAESRPGHSRVSGVRTRTEDSNDRGVWAFPGSRAARSSV